MSELDILLQSIGEMDAAISTLKLSRESLWEYLQELAAPEVLLSEIGLKVGDKLVPNANFHAHIIGQLEIRNDPRLRGNIAITVDGAKLFRDSSRWVAINASRGNRNLKFNIPFDIAKSMKKEES